MHYGIEVINLGAFADPRIVIKLAQAAESAGWEAIFLWDHLAFVWNSPAIDPWITLTAVATSTTRMKLGTGVTPLPRHRPHVLAQSLTTLDILSQGRVILGAGLGGVPQEYTAFGESADPRQHAAMVDESLTILNQLWSGEKVTYHGTHYTVDGVTLKPLPIQRPRIPIWIGGESPPALRRAARWDGWIMGGVNQDGTMNKTPEQVAQKVGTIRQYRTATAPFDVALTGYSTPLGGTLAREFESAGVTWWLESLHGSRGSVDEMIARAKAGPPK
jgi:probable F420-dependent oxidoreductase